MLDETDKKKRYGHRAIKWYKKKHITTLDGNVYAETKPIKNAAELKEATKKEFKSFGTSVAKAYNKTEGAIKEAKLGDKISGFWRKVTGKKKEEN